MSDQLHRSFLYAPASSERLLAKVLARGADVVILDLEDAVAPDQKAAARDAVVAFLAAVELAGDPDRPAIQVRVNRDGVGWDADDVAAAISPVVEAITLPKAEDAEQVALVAEHLHDTAIGLHLIIESAQGVAAVEALAGAPRVVRLGLGAADLTADLGMHVAADHPALDHVRGRLVVASRIAGIQAPVDSVHLVVDDPDGLRRAAQRAREFGFFGKSVIHPAQIAVVHDVFTPGEAETARAEAIVAAAEAAERDGQGAVLLDGELVDPPVVHRARGILRLANANRKANR